MILQELPEGEDSPSEPILEHRAEATVTARVTPAPMYICNTHDTGNFPCDQSQISDEECPPSYEDVMNPNAPPPSYESLFGRVCQAHIKSKGVLDFLKNVLLLLLGTIGCSIIVGVTIVVPVSMIVMAFTYWNECPKCSYIPVYLLVGGVVGLVKQLVHFLIRAGVCKAEPEPPDERPRRRQSTSQTIINCFLLGWFFIGSVWVFRAYEPNYDPDSREGDYCNKTIYLFSFWLLTSVYIFLGVVIVSLCAISTVAIACQRQL